MRILSYQKADTVVVRAGAPTSDTATDVAGARSRWRSDLVLVCVAAIAAYGFASTFELYEALSIRLIRFERWQADEIPFGLTVLACGLAWYAWRRRSEVQLQLVLRSAAEARVADLLEHNRLLARQLIAVQESDRLALARELHDELGQSCTAIRVETAFLRGCAVEDRQGMLEAAARVDGTAQTLYQVLSRVLRRLRPTHLDSLGLEAALEELCDAWQQRTGVGCSLAFIGAVEAIGDPVDVTIYRVTQEALTNVARHARARHVTVGLSVTDVAAVTLTIEDDGQGMNVGVVRRGLGLLGAVERVAAVHGELLIRSRPGQGVRIVATMPLRAVPGSEASPPAVEATAMECPWKVAA